MRRVLNIIVTVLLFIGLALLGVFVFRGSYIRFGQGCRDCGYSVVYYFCELFGIDNGITQTVTEIPKEAEIHITLPQNWSLFREEAGEYFSLLFSWDNFKSLGTHLTQSLSVLMKVLLILLPCIILLSFFVKWLYRKENHKYGKDTIPLRVFKFIANGTYRPIKRFIQSYIAFLREHAWIRTLWIIVWIFHFNLATVLIEFFAFYFYFAISYDLGAIWTQAIKLFGDLRTPFVYFPYWSLGFLVWAFFNRWRKRIATGRLRHFEARNCGFINELPIVSMSCGSMGKKKTTVITDMVLSQEVMFRQKANEILQNNDMKFPFFPWICFEKELQKCIEYGAVYNLATVKEWVALKRRRFLCHRNAYWQLYGYDYRRYGLTYDNGLTTCTLFDVLETYAQAYFIYVIESSLIVANYSIRTDNKLLDNGNFPVWLTDFFPARFRRESRHAKVLDFDVLRLGRKVMENNPNIGSFEFGVVAITEIGKERGNNLELKEIKKGDDVTNQKNDMFNAWLKMCRHSATVDFFPFIKVFVDEQRPESWGADARDLCDIIRIISSSDTKLALPFYTIEEMISERAFNRFINLYYDFRFRRGDNTLLVHILKTVTAWLWRRNIRMYNRYGYSVMRIEKEKGTMDGKAEKKKYYLCNAKIYRRRFATDCFSDYFNDMARNSRVGLADYLEYITEKASVEELQAQNSYFVNSLYGRN